MGYCDRASGRFICGAVVSDASDTIPPPDSRQVRRLYVNPLAQILLLAAGEENADFVRTGNMACEICGETYGRHAEDPFAPWLNVLCDGRRVKL